MRRLLRVPLILLAWTLVPGCLKVPVDTADDPASAGTVPSTPSEVLSRYVEGLGGEAALRALSQRTVEARLVLRAEEGCAPEDRHCLGEDQSGSSLHLNTNKGHMYQRTVVGDSVEEHGFDGTLGWGLLGDQTLRIDTPDEAKLSHEEGLLHWYLDVEGRGVQLEMLPPRAEDSAQQPMVLDGITWKAPASPLAKELWFARDTGLLREEISRNEQGDLKQSQTVSYSDYRDIDGVKVPHAITVENRVGDRAQRVEFTTQRVHHEPLDETRFAIPTLPEAKPEPDPLLQRLSTVASEARSEPKDVAAQVEWARTAFMAAHFDEAEKAARAALALDANEPEALLTLIRIHTLRAQYSQAEKFLKVGHKAGLREQVLAREEAWILHRKHEFAPLAEALDRADNGALAGRYRAFAGTPLAKTWPAQKCSETVNFLEDHALALLPVDIGGTTTGAIFDTGAADLIISESLADTLGVAIQSRTKIAEGLPDIGHGQVESIQVGSLVLGNVPVNVFDDLSIQQMAGESKNPVQAVFGAALLQDFVVRVDMGARALELVPATRKCAAQAEPLRSGPSVPIYLHETHYLYIPAQMNEAEGLYLLNTGMRGADMTANRFANSYAGIGTPPMRSDETPMVKVARLELSDGVVIEQANSAYGLFQQTQSSDGFRVDGMLGLGALGRRPFVIDFERLKLFFPSR